MSDGVATVRQTFGWGEGTAQALFTANYCYPEVGLGTRPPLSSTSRTAFGKSADLCAASKHEGGTLMILHLVALLVLGLMCGSELNVALFSHPVLKRSVEASRHASGGLRYPQDWFRKTPQQK
jgi:hypothetical protein